MGGVELTVVHAEVRGDAQKLKDSRLADRTRALRVIERTLQEGGEGLGKQGLSERSLLFNYGARVGMEHARRKQRGGSEPSLLRRLLARLRAVSSIWGHWLGGLRGSWASRSPSLEADARAVLALMTRTGRLRERVITGPVQRESRDSGW